MKLYKLLVFASCLLILSGCAGKPINFGYENKVDPKNVDFDNGRNISASSGGFQLLLFIPININNRHNRALKQLREKAGSDYITDIKIRESWAWGFVGTAYITSIAAKAYPIK